MATIPTQNHGELVGNVTYKYIDWYETKR
jgi:hypothetical protein